MESMESASIAAVPGPAGDASAPGEKGLKTGAISYISGVVIAVASTAPGYSLAATLGFIVAIDGIGLQAPAVILLAFIPMGCIAAAYNALNKAEPDCGTTFAWVASALGPRLGWMAGWAVLVADILVMPSLASIAAIYSCSLFGADDPSTAVVLVIGVAWIAVMTWICFVGIELSAETQRFLLGMELFTLVVFAAVALIKVFTGDPEGSIEPSLSWFNPLEISSSSAMAGGVLLAIFIYWGWDSAVSVNEETENGREASGKAAVVATVILLAIYAIVATAAQAFGGTQSLIDNQTDVFAPIAEDVLGSPLDKLLIIAVLTSAAASTQTTILPATRSALSMARRHALPRSFGTVHPEHQTPSVATIWMGAISTFVFAFLLLTSENLVADAFTSLSMTIAFYYGITGLACAWFFRHHLLTSARSFLTLALLPLTGAATLTWVFVKAINDYSAADGGYAKALFGIGSPVIITIVMAITGIVLMLLQWRAHPEYFRSVPAAVDPALGKEIAGG
jgi:amino acid transporter